uniref:Uncharacterized protein n=1 Tax=Arundo donax TaxID=35708 RepID=A0A0A8XXB5_ARUDO
MWCRYKLRKRQPSTAPVSSLTTKRAWWYW